MLLRIGSEALTKWSCKLFPLPNLEKATFETLSNALYLALVESVILPTLF